MACFFFSSHHGGVSEGITWSGGVSIREESLQRNVLGSRWATSRSASRSAELTPLTSVYKPPPIAFMALRKGAAASYFLGSPFFRIRSATAAVFGLSFLRSVKSIRVLPNPMYNLLSKTWAWHCIQLGATTVSPFAAFTAVYSWLIRAFGPSLFR